MYARNFNRLLRISTPRLLHSPIHPTTNAHASPSPYFFAAAALAATASTASTFALCDSSPLSTSFLDTPPPNLSVLSTTEAQTGVQYPLVLPEGGRLQGTGVRKMGGVVQVYALGFYADERELRKLLGDWRGFSEQELLESPGVWEKLCQASELKRTFRLVVVREVHGSHMQKGFERGLMPRAVARSRRGKCKPAQVKRAVKMFGGVFGGVGVMKVGSEIRIEVVGDRVGVWVDGRWMGEVGDGILAWAMGDLFLGEKSVAPTIREGVAEGLETVLKE